MELHCTFSVHFNNFRRAAPLTDDEDDDFRRFQSIQNQVEKCTTPYTKPKTDVFVPDVNISDDEDIIEQISKMDIDMDSVMDCSFAESTVSLSFYTFLLFCLDFQKIRPVFSEERFRQILCSACHCFQRSSRRWKVKEGVWLPIPRRIQVFTQILDYRWECFIWPSCKFDLCFYECYNKKINFLVT